MRLSSCDIEGASHHCRSLSLSMTAKTAGSVWAVRCSMGARLTKEGGWFQVIGAMKETGMVLTKVKAESRSSVYSSEIGVTMVV
ncbi:hypothetical protein V6N11_083999 [Hibiscus sabdariffa]|uniref:Uncharacterized protein n=1 Tax=Hibiscus sabdariffa TaxID=183260 RepID=A0ABR2QDM9_9ROSI